MQTAAGHCGKCGAPYYVPTVWHSILPPTPTPSCCCWNTAPITTTTATGSSTGTLVTSSEFKS